MQGISFQLRAYFYTNNPKLHLYLLNLKKLVLNRNVFNTVNFTDNPMNPNFIYIIIAINIFAFCQVAIDKQLAIRKNWRIPEIQLIAPALIGGMIGIILGMFTFRHKTRKARFQIKLALAIAVFAGGVYFLWPM